MRRAVGWSVAAAVAAGASVALAATLGTTTTKVGSGNASILACDTNGFTETYTTSAGMVTAVTISGIADPACEGGSLQLTLTSATEDRIASGGPQTVPTDGDTVDNSMTVSVSPQPVSSLVAGIRISIAGP